MKIKQKYFIVSCSGWQIGVRSTDSESAAVLGLSEALKKFGKKLLLSTTIMVKDITDFKINFHCCHEILKKIGLNDLAEGIRIISKSNKLSDFSVK